MDRVILGSAEAGATLSQVSVAWGSIRSGIVHLFNDRAAETGTGLSHITYKGTHRARIRIRHRQSSTPGSGARIETRATPGQARPVQDSTVQYSTAQYSYRLVLGQACRSSAVGTMCHVCQCKIPLELKHPSSSGRVPTQGNVEKGKTSGNRQVTSPSETEWRWRDDPAIERRGAC